MPEFSSAPGIRSGKVIATYADYGDAQRLVDFLSDKGFAVQHVRILGRGLHSVEQVVGRVTAARAGLSGAISGAALGLLFGALLGIFVKDLAWWKPLLLGALFGAIWGGVSAFVGHAMTKGQRDFASLRGLSADHYDVEVDADHADQATALAAQLPRKLTGISG